MSNPVTDAHRKAAEAIVVPVLRVCAQPCIHCDTLERERNVNVERLAAILAIHLPDHSADLSAENERQAAIKYRL